MEKTYRYKGFFITARHVPEGPYTTLMLDGNHLCDRHAPDMLTEPEGDPLSYFIDMVNYRSFVPEAFTLLDDYETATSKLSSSERESCAA